MRVYPLGARPNFFAVVIYRAIHNRENPYFMVVRETAQDKLLPARALGVLVYLMSKPDTWEPTIEDICRRFPDIGKNQAYKIINEILIPLGYARRVPERVHGKITRWVTEIYESPVHDFREIENPENQTRPVPENREIENSDFREKLTGSPVPENREVETSSRLSGDGFRELDINRVQNTDCCKEEENTDFMQQQQAEPREIAAAAAQPNEPHSSRFSLSQVQQFVEATKRHAINPGGLARKLWRTGEEDDRIAEWIEAEILQAKHRDARLTGPNDDFGDFSMDDYIDGLIAHNDLAQLQYEMEGITERGGPTLEWERRVIAYLQHAASDAA